MSSDDKIRVHVKNNHASIDTFPSTVEGEEVFSITAERFAEAAARHPDIADRLDVFIDWDLDHFYESIKTANVLIAWDFPTRDIRTAAPNLEWVHIIGAGVEHLCPMDWVPDDLVIVNNKGAHAAKAGEFGIMSTLMLHTLMPAICWNQRHRRWRSLYSTPIAGKTALVIGVGSIGHAVAQNLKTMGMQVIGVSRHGGARRGVDEMFAVAQLEEVLPRADYVFVATPATPETEGLLDRRRLDLLKKGAGIVNVGRASVIDYEALAEKLASGELSGAVLDVFDPEPLPETSKLWDVPNLIITPHISADDGNNYVSITLDLFFNNMRRYLQGETLHNIVRADLGY